MPTLYLIKNNDRFKDYDWAIQLEWPFELDDLKGEPGDFILEFSNPHERIILKKEEFMQRYGETWTSGKKQDY